MLREYGPDRRQVLPSSHCILGYKFVSMPGELNHDRSSLLLDSKGMFCHSSFSLTTSGLHNSESSKGKISTLICRGPQMSISFRCGDFIVVWNKFWNSNYLFEVEFLQHFLQLRNLSRAGRILCRGGLHELDRPVVPKVGGTSLLAPVRNSRGR